MALSLPVIDRKQAVGCLRGLFHKTNLNAHAQWFLAHGSRRLARRGRRLSLATQGRIVLRAVFVKNCDQKRILAGVLDM
ncbi:MAG: hypothetical protein DMG61_12785 [Acidobacteria bacterium]|nr:MAG: hypothetical protein DMG61_12785 [Acidobacteriota bacterium]